MVERASACYVGIHADTWSFYIFHQICFEFVILPVNRGPRFKSVYF
jgi:hypothetical protein